MYGVAALFSYLYVKRWLMCQLLPMTTPDPLQQCISKCLQFAHGSQSALLSTLVLVPSVQLWVQLCVQLIPGISMVLHAAMTLVITSNKQT